MKSGILIRPYATSDLEAVASCYANGEIWSDEPWNEHLRCPKCPEGANNYGRSFEGQTCPACGSGLVPFWNEQTVAKDVVRQLVLPKAGCFVALDTRHDSHLIGFTWGYVVEQIRTWSIPLLGLTFPQSDKHFPPTWNPPLGYIDEVGVHQKYRQQGIGETLTLNLLHHFSAAGIYSVLLRTDERAEAAVRLYEKLGFVRDPALKDPLFAHRGYWRVDTYGLSFYALEHGKLISPRGYKERMDAERKSGLHSPGHGCEH